MHWSKTRHSRYSQCPRRFFYSVVASPRNPAIGRLEEASTSSPALIRHETVRAIIGEIVKAPKWDDASIDPILDAAEAKLGKLIAEPVEANAQFSIVDECVRAFVEEILPTIDRSTVQYISDGDPIEFVYAGLTILALPELVLDEAGRLHVLGWRTGSASFRDEQEFSLRAGGLTCCGRTVFKCVDRPVTVSEVFLRDKVNRFEETMDDEEVRAFVTEAKRINGQYSRTAKIRDFPAQPTLDTCRFCPFQPVCPEWQEFSEVDFGIAALAEEVADAVSTKVDARVEVGGEVRDVFLSHASEDKDTMVRPFARRLDAEGISYWLDEAELFWGDSLNRGLNKGLATSDAVVCFVTEAFLSRGWPQDELAGAVAAGKPVLPILSTSIETLRSEYPILADKLFKRWDDGLDAITEELKRVLARRRAGE